LRACGSGNGKCQLGEMLKQVAGDGFAGTTKAP
jgi:hypothetical protein